MRALLNRFNVVQYAARAAHMQTSTRVSALHANLSVTACAAAVLADSRKLHAVVYGTKTLLMCGDRRGLALRLNAVSLYATG